ncbi:MAG: hypothetical protein HWQ35_34550 [Nostoc sp. NMS1]|uniref:hypothetical protein n=1 Tax=Nostoc sp. NMS1 TaxID=2815388 RepID=UPI0025FAE0B8|nr:hypothetical protein [Nostoc sp. NMS1]MBN3911473.1 hypothetical protein [Nostoc sp. NMS1]
MTHFKALIILPQNTINITEKVAELLSPYYSELEVEPYKEYLNKSELQVEMQNLSTLSKENIEELIEEYEVSGDNLLENLAKINLDWYEEDIAGSDEQGAYRLTTLNPCSKWDWYDFIEVESIESELPINYPCRVADLPNIVPYALITPDGQWYEAGADLGLQAFKRIYLLNNKQVSEEEVSWDLDVQKILASYSDYLAVAIHCHI